jgi:hypothetical protein
MSATYQPAKGIEPSEADIGRGVIYRGFGPDAEQGYITSFNDHNVFVRYGNSATSQATSRSDLDWLAA